MKTIKTNLALKAVAVLALAVATRQPTLAKNAGEEVDTETEAREPASQVSRPPQFVLLAFDGSLNLDMWDETYKFADTIVTDDGKSKLHFTYFVSPVYYTAHENRKVYNTPLAGPGVSCIGWSSKLSDIPLRVERTNRAFEAGHEIGSHANAHCTQAGTEGPAKMLGHPWTTQNWDSEFEQFDHLLFDTFKINHVNPVAGAKNQSGFSFTINDIKGFRAPLLEWTSGLYPALNKYNFKYDTSQQASPDYWPQRKPWGGWNIPLGLIKVAGTHRPRRGVITSMDYNWFYFHSNGLEVKNLSPQQRDTWYNQVFDSYMYYFKKNYFGNRAPVQIGDHFSKWNGAVYWDALMNFAKAVCSKPEVRCVTISEFTKWAESQGASYDLYRKGAFEMLPDDHTIKDIDAPVMAEVRLESDEHGFEAIVAHEDRKRVHNLGMFPRLFVNMESTGKSKLSRDELLQAAHGAKVVMVRAAIVNRSGVQVNWQTYKIENFGTMSESMTGPLEDQIPNDSAEAHEGLPQ